MRNETKLMTKWYEQKIKRFKERRKKNEDEERNNKINRDLKYVNSSSIRTNWILILLCISILMTKLLWSFVFFWPTDKTWNLYIYCVFPHWACVFLGQIMCLLSLSKSLWCVSTSKNILATLVRNLIEKTTEILIFLWCRTSFIFSMCFSSFEIVKYINLYVCVCAFVWYFFFWNISIVTKIEKLFLIFRIKNFSSKIFIHIYLMVST